LLIKERNLKEKPNHGKTFTTKMSLAGKKVLKRAWGKGEESPGGKGPGLKSLMGKGRFSNIKKKTFVDKYRGTTVMQGWGRSHTIRGGRQRA